MKKLLIFGLFMILTSVNLFPNLIGEPAPSSETIYVDDGDSAGFTSIEDAFDYANDRDTVFVNSGTYYENMQILKSLDLIGEKSLVKPEGANEPPDILWSETYEDTFSAFSVQQTSDGGYVLCGTTGEDAFLIKTDKNGSEEWKKYYGGTYDDEAGCAIECSDGGYVFTGSDGYTPYHGHSEPFLIKTDEDGNELWNKTFRLQDREGSSWGKRIIEVSDGYVILAVLGIWGMEEQGGTWLIKTDKNGSELWNRTYGGGLGSLGDVGNSLIQSNDGGFVITGIGYSFDIGGGDAWLLKTDSEGNELWNKSYGGYSYDTGEEVIQTDDGGYIIVGRYTPVNEAWGDVCLIKTDSSGNMEWIRHYGGSDLDCGESIARTDDNGYIIAGTTHSFGLGGFTSWIIKTDGNGNKLWSKITGGWRANKIIRSNDGKYVVAGCYSGNAWLFKIDTFENNRPAKPTHVYYEDIFQLKVSSTDPDNDAIRYGISWDNNGVVDEWTDYYESGEKARILCLGRKNPAYIIAEDEHGGQSEWVMAKAKDVFDAESDWAALEVSMPKNKAINQFLLFLERLIERFPILEQILQPIYDKLVNL